MPPKSKWRSDDAQTFTLVHRSQRDPLINDPEASSRVLAPAAQRKRRTNAHGQPVTRNELEEEFKGKERGNIGEAANYGVYFDDTEYDYMQHLRAIGDNYNSRRGGNDEEDDVDVVMLPGPQTKGKGKAKAASGDIEFKDEGEGDRANMRLPDEVLASKEEMPRDWSRGTREEGGLRLDMDPHLRQVLEALDDDAFLAGKAKEKAKMRAIQASQSGSRLPEAGVSEGANGAAVDDQDGADLDDGEDDDDDFEALFSEVVAGGEYDPDEVDTVEEDWRRQVPGGDEALYMTAGERAKEKLKQQGQAAILDDPNLSLSERVALFKEGLAPGAGGVAEDESPAAGPQPTQGKTRRVASSTGGSSIFGEGAPGKKHKAGSKARHAMSYYAPSADGGSTAWSMSSSAMARNSGLQHVDEGFDRMEQIYEQDGEEEENDEDYGEDGEGPMVREDFEDILDEFLNKHEVIAGRLRQRLGAPDASGAEKLNILRHEIGAAKIDRWLAEREESQEEIDKDIESRIRVVGMPKDDWDVETIQSTRTNLDNHPRLLSYGAPSSMASRSSFRPSTLASGSKTNGSSSTSSDGFESIPKVRINKRTGVPEVVGWTKQRRPAANGKADADGLPPLSSLSIDDRDDDDGSGPPPSPHANGHSASMPSAEDGEDSDDSGDDTETESTILAAHRRATVKRDRNESKEDKKARKDAAKTAKTLRKTEKSQRKTEFANERKRQAKIDAARVKAGGLTRLA